MNEQARRVQVCVAGEIEVVDLCAFEDGCLLRSDVRREEQEPVVGVIGRQVRSAALQSFDDDSDILMTEMPLLLDKVPKGSLKCFPSDDTVETRQCFPGRADFGPRHPPLESRPVQVEVARNFRPSHVHQNTTFINNEQEDVMNSPNRPVQLA